MEGIKVTLEPNMNKDYQAFTFDDLGITYFEWSKMSEDDQRILILENIVENICSCVGEVEEY